MISVVNLAKRYGAQVLFEDVSLRFDPGKRYGIVGANGAGKSTFLRLLTGEEYADKGEINLPSTIRIGTMNQDHFAFEDWQISDVVMLGKKELGEAVREKERLLHDPHSDPMKIAEMEMVIADHDGYVAEAQIAEILTGLGIPDDRHFEPMSILSGGYKLRVLLAQVLFSDPDVLLLDEPTNHLDILSIRWLEQFLCQRPGTVMIVSHDRSFLNSVCTHIADVDYQTIRVYKGNYDGFLAAKEADDTQRQQEAEKAEKRIDELQQFVTKFKAKATKARQAQSKSRMIERMEKDLSEPLYSSRIFPRIKFEPIRPPGKSVLEITDLSKSYGEHKVLSNLHLRVHRGDKLAIIGPNGVGKSTLLKILMDHMQADAGEVTWGHETHPSYFAQDHHAEIKDNTSPYEWLYQFAPGESIGVIRGTLGNVLFSGDDVHKSTAALSGGECARLIIAKMMLLKGNVLVLDEPTNHLDMESIESLVDALIEFDGTILLVSHNRYVVEKLATRVLELKPDGFDFFDGSYVEFIDKVGIDHLAYQVDQGEKSNDRKPAKNDRKQQKLASVAQRKAYRQEAKEALDEIALLEDQISAFEKEIATIDDQFSDPVYFARTAPDEVRRMNDKKKQQQTDLDSALLRWTELQEQVEELKSSHQIHD